jgi:hypothetical protein
MKAHWAALPFFVACSLASANGFAAGVAIIPVQGVNLSEGQCDAIGVLFSNAFARDAHVAVWSPADTKPVWTQVRASAAVAERLGASQYIELTAIRLGAKVTVAGILFSSDGREVFRAETSASSLDEMDAVTARLARALIWRQPIPASTPGPQRQRDPSVPETPVVPEAPYSGLSSYNMYGPKGGLVFPVASGYSLSPQITVQFDARIGPRSHFFEFAVGIAGPMEDTYSDSAIRATNFFGELGGSAYLTDGGVGLYVGGGVVPGIWESKTSTYNSTYGYSYDSNTRSGAMFAVYGQMGITFTRDMRTRIFGEIRLAQHLLSVTDPAGGGTFHPTMLALQMGLGW